MTIDWSLLSQYAPELISGTELTIALWLVGSLLALVIGFVLGLLLSVGPRWVGGVIRCYVEFFRGTPLLVQLFIIYAGGPHIGITLSALTVGIWGLGLYGGAYFTEIFRAGFASIPAGQIDAARSFCMTRGQTIRHVVVPQMLTLVLPPVVNMLIVVLKDTAVLSILTIPELTFQVTGMTLETFAYVEPYFALAVVYWVLVELTAVAGRTAEAKLTHRLAWA
jgi:polar amino acid transport system permease protein